MKNCRFAILALFFCISTIASQAQNLLKYVPADATAVIAYYPQNLKKKVDVNQLKQVGFMDMAMGQMTAGMTEEKKALMKQTFNDPSLAGINPLQSSYFFANVDQEYITMSYLMPVQDMPRLERFIKESTGNALNLTQQDGFTQADLEDGAMMAFNNEVLMFIGSIDNPNNRSYEYEYEYEEYEEGEEIEEDNTNVSPEESLTETMQMRTQALVYQALQDGISNPLTQNARFLASEANKGDMGLWIDYEKLYGPEGMYKNLYSELGDEFGMYMQVMGELYKDMNVAMSVNFDDGLIDITSQTVGSGRFQQWMQAVTDEKINKKFHKYIDGQDLMGYYAFAIDQESLIDGMIEMLLPSVQDIPFVGNPARDGAKILDIFIDQDEIYDILDGDFFIGVTGMGSFTKEVTSYEYDEDFNEIETTREVTTELPKFLFMASYGEEDYIKRFMRVGENVGLTKNMGSYQVFQDLPDVPFDVYVTAQEGILFITNDQQLITNQVKSGVPKSNRLSRAHCKRLKKKNFNAYVNFDNILKVAAPYAAMGGDAAVQGIENFQNTFDEVLMYSDRGKGDIKGKVQLTFKDESKNSLEQFFLFINEVALSSLTGISM